MLDVLTIVTPVFGLIALGYIAGRTKILSEAAGPGISQFAFSLGIPALLCRTIATAKLQDLSPLAIWTSFYAAAAVTWIAATLLTTRLLDRPAEDGPSVAMSAVFGNTAMLGIPVAISTFGPAAAAPIALILSIHAPILWLTGMIHAEAVGAKPQSSLAEIVRSVLSDLVRNPIVVGIMIGAAWRLTGLELPKALDRILELLAQAGVPASLVALGLTLLGFQVKGQMPTLVVISATKLVLMPLVAWLIGAKVFGLAPLPLGVLVILASMPTGANAFLFAVRQDRAVNSASGSVALGTIVAAVTVSVIVSLVKP